MIVIIIVTQVQADLPVAGALSRAPFGRYDNSVAGCRLVGTPYHLAHGHMKRLAARAGGVMAEETSCGRPLQAPAKQYQGTTIYKFLESP